MAFLVRLRLLKFLCSLAQLTLVKSSKSTSTPVKIKLNTLEVSLVKLVQRAEHQTGTTEEVPRSILTADNLLAGSIFAIPYQSL